MKQPKILLAVLSVAAVAAWGVIYQFYVKPSFASADTDYIQKQDSEHTAFLKDLDLVHLDRLRDLVRNQRDSDKLYAVIAGQLGWAYLTKENKGRATPEMMRAFYRKTRFPAGFLAGRTEVFTYVILKDDPDPALVEVAIENSYPYKRITFTGGKSLLHLAIEKDRLQLAQSLVKNHPELLTIKDDGGQTPLDTARTQGKVQFTHILTQAQNHG